jgi:hypothetical protein
MAAPVHRKDKQSAILALGVFGAVIGAALGALIAGPGSGFTGVLFGAAGAALGGAILDLWFKRIA